jgi:hypothetical protein
VINSLYEVVRIINYPNPLASAKLGHTWMMAENSAAPARLALVHLKAPGSEAASA